MTETDSKILLLSARFLNDVADEILRARKKFPSNIHMHAAFAEEAGEIANALLERDYGSKTDKDVWEECVQAAAMALRVASEGDPSFKYRAPDYWQHLPQPLSSNKVMPDSILSYEDETNLHLTEPGPEEGGEDSFPMVTHCINSKCGVWSDHADAKQYPEIVVLNGFRVCPKCRMSYGPAEK